MKAFAVVNCQQWAIGTGEWPATHPTGQTSAFGTQSWVCEAVGSISEEFKEKVQLLADLG